MGLLARLYNIRRAIFLKWGSAYVKERIWNKEFASGRWACLEHTEKDCLYPILEKYCCGGDILDLGCGSGNTGNELNPVCYGRLLGVDISAVAIRQARERTRLTGRASKNTYQQGDIETFLPRCRYRVILFRESIYYVPFFKVKPMLRRYKAFLDDQGVFIVRLYDRHSNAVIVKLIEENYAIRERYEDPDGKTAILVFR